MTAVSLLGCGGFLLWKKELYWEVEQKEYCGYGILIARHSLLAHGQHGKHGV